MSEEIKYDNPKYQRFNESLDTDGVIVIAGYSFLPSSILFEMDIQGYKEAFNDFVAQDHEDLKQTVIDTYPACIAYHLRLAERGPNFEDPIQKLGHLKDTWEAIINILHAIAWGEVRNKNINLQGAQVFTKLNIDGSAAYGSFNTRRLLSDSIKHRIHNIEAIVSHSKSNNFNLKCEQISNQLIERLSELQDVRNNVAHSAVLTKEEAEGLMLVVQPIFAAMLDLTRFLANCEILRFTNFNPPDISCAVYQGYSLHREQIKFQVDTDLPANSLSYIFSMTNEQVFLIWGEDVFSLSPFLHYQNDDMGHESYLCVYKGRKDSLYWYEPVKLRNEISFTDKQARFQAELVEIQTLIGVDQ